MKKSHRSKVARHVEGFAAARPSPGGASTPRSTSSRRATGNEGASAPSRTGKRAMLRAALRAVMRQPADTVATQQVSADHPADPPSVVIPRPSKPETGGIDHAVHRGMNGRIELPETFDVTSVRALHAALVTSTGEVRLDGSKVAVADAAGAQLLAALALSGRAVHLTASPVLSELLTVTAVNSLLSLEQ
jgi:hypothetical protein